MTKISECTIYLVRHGQSETNVICMFAGHRDVQLSEIGKKQAQGVKNFFADKDIDLVYTSDLVRCVQTVMPLIDEHNPQIITCPALREIYGGYWEGMCYQDIENTYPEEHAIWKNEPNIAVCPGGESVDHMAQRVYLALEKIAEENLGKTLVVCTHSTPIRTLVANIYEGKIDRMKTIPPIKNAGICRLQYKDHQFRILDFNLCDHLEGIITQPPSGY